MLDTTYIAELVTQLSNRGRIRVLDGTSLPQNTQHDPLSYFCIFLFLVTL